MDRKLDANVDNAGNPLLNKKEYSGFALQPVPCTLEPSEQWKAFKDVQCIAFLPESKSSKKSGSGSGFCAVLCDARCVLLLDLETCRVKILAGMAADLATHDYTLGTRLGQGFSDGKAKGARFNWPQGIAVSSGGDCIYLADNNRIRQVMTKSGRTATLAGRDEKGGTEGAKGKAKFDDPRGICLHQETVFIADTKNHRIRKLDLRMQLVGPVAGNGQAGLKNGRCVGSKFKSPHDVAADASGRLVVADTENHCVRLIDLQSDTVSILAGTGHHGIVDGPCGDAQFRYPVQVCCDGLGNTLVLDSDSAWSGNKSLRLINGRTGFVSTLTENLRSAPMAFDPMGQLVLICPEGPAVASGLYTTEDMQHFARQSLVPALPVLPAGIVSIIAHYTVHETHPATELTPAQRDTVADKARNARQEPEAAPVTWTRYKD